MGALAGRDFHTLLQKTAEDRLGQWKRYALSLTRNEADADDAVQDAIANTLRVAPDLDSEIRVHHYVRRAIHNTALSTIAGQRRTIALTQPETTLPGASSVLELMLDRERAAERRHLGRVVERNLGRLRSEHRELIENMIMRSPRRKLREMAQIQRVATPTIHYRLRRALERLLELVEEETR